MNTEEIILMKLPDIVFVDKRPFCYEDFLTFEYNGKEYKFEYGTIRNIFSNLYKNRDMEKEYRPGPTFLYCPRNQTWKINDNKPYGGWRSSFSKAGELQCLCEISMDKPAIHDIRKFYHSSGLPS
jgi:hypothetical protein